MLKQRLLTAAILIPLVIWITIALPNVAFRAISAFVVLIGAWEWSVLMGQVSLRVRVLFTAGIGCAFILAHVLLNQISAEIFLGFAFLWWLIVSWDLLRSGQPNKKQMQAHFGLRVLSGIIVLVAGWFAMAQLHAIPQNGPNWVLFLLVLIWTVDSAAYFVGRRFGKHKLAPVISPGKTWEGFWGGLAGAALIALVGLQLFPMGNELWLGFIVLCVVTAVFSVLGDLFESAAKRRAQVKDSGHLLPGHGGILDRIDSLLAAAPVFALGLAWLQP